MRIGPNSRISSGSPVDFASTLATGGSASVARTSDISVPGAATFQLAMARHSAARVSISARVITGA